MVSIIEMWAADTVLDRLLGRIQRAGHLLVGPSLIGHVGEVYD